ncbi:hypothetical protein [Methanosarcina mazei]|uniref:Uncharacterized protein n=8 Tax=Methanosarcina mazei TaxID=2209 RepID=A0A0F8JUI9_METMZ|nr:hypothetical protein [Methanosarcina mazei]AAM30227.1 conserved protein [Methanosarcina mazei Go1]AGF95973.1 Hypothetical protein MmTuc01_0553 [Methanosarcina mazei Tuc01]AKB39755.1 hypothetical protein MSMAW_0764 [Methanosarcina mazei WWM610]AKB60723.1 hypothetical protein MSMAP_0738 [Methanosarcina mazei SarPi]AKB63972.1 hypothetical protein MSMAS_0776 [Methanosarcina mazei S-6]
MKQKRIKKTVRKFSDLIERNKDRRAYSDYKEGINEGLEIAKDTFEDNVEKFLSTSTDEDPQTKIRSLQDRFNLIIDTIVVKEKPNYSQDHLDGIYEGFEKSKKIFENCIQEYYHSDSES